MAINSGAVTFFQIIGHLVWTFVTLFSFSTAIASNDDQAGASNVTKYVAEEEVNDLEEVEVQVKPNEEPVKGEEVFVFPISK